MAKKQARQVKLPIHSEVLSVLKQYVATNELDITVAALGRYLITYAHHLIMDEGYYLQAAQAIGALDDTNLEATHDDIATNGRTVLRMTTSSALINNCSDEENYQYLIASMLDLNIGVDELGLSFFRL